MVKINARKALVSCCLIVAVCTLFPLSVAAQPPEDFDRPPTKGQAENVRKKIENLRMWKLTKALDLDEKTSARVFPVLNKYDKKRFDAERDLREDMRSLREAVRDGKDAQIKQSLERLDRSHEALQKIRDEERAELKKILNVRQQAEYILFMQDFDMEMRRMIEEARDRRGFERNPGFGGPERRFPRDR